jgi:ABC-type phosphate transport system substrate-binding protein
MLHWFTPHQLHETSAKTEIGVVNFFATRRTRSKDCKQQFKTMTKKGLSTTAWLLACLLVLCAGPAWPGCDAADISGEGRAWLQDLHTTLSNSYVFTQDSATITYTPTTDLDAAFASLGRGRISFVSTPAVLGSTRSTGQRGVLHSVPLAATAMVMAYNASQLGGQLVLDVATTAAMWRGNLTTWDDSRLTALNPWLAATGPVRLIYCGDADGEGDLLLRFLARVDPDLAALLAGGAGFAALEPVQAGRAVQACSTEDKLAALVTAGASPALAFMMLPETLSRDGLGLASMRVTDKAGAQVVVAVAAGAQLAALTNAMALTPQSLRDIVNDGTNASWPLAAIVSAVVDSDLGLAINNCYMIKHVFDFASWLQVNDGAIAQLQPLGYAPLGPYHRRVTLEQMTEVTCNNNTVVSTSYLLGSGPPFEVYNALADEYSSAGFLLKYYESASSLQAITDMIDSSADFGTSGATLTPEQQALVPDAVAVPMMSYGIVFAYNLPGLLDQPALVLDFATVADIYMGRVASWNDSRIAALNPSIAHLLPDEPLIVLYVTTAQVLISLANTAISHEVPEYAAAVGNSSRSDIYPVVSLAPNRTLAVSNLGATQAALNSVPYLFGASNTFAAGTRPNIAMASLVGGFSAGRALAPTKATIVNAISNATDPSSQQIYFAPGTESWPVVATNAFIVRTRSMPSVVKARGLAEWIYWIHSSEAGQTIADAHQVIPSGSSPVLMRRITAAVVNITVDGVAVSPLAGCADAASGVLCSERGNCSSAGRCVCEVGWHGDLCELADASAGSDGSSDTTALTVALSTVVPAAVVALCLLAVCSALALLVIHRRGRLDNYDWEIDPAELELGDQLGAGGYGVVHKALWKGTEVAVKMIGGDAVAYGSVQVANFRREAQVMSALRHPNVVLFMAACTKPPKMCIVMEYMSLGSLYDVRLSASDACAVCACRVSCVCRVAALRVR